MTAQNVHGIEDALYTRYRDAANQLAKQYAVKDIVPDTAVFIFLLESPHIQELKYGAPVSGSSGASMSRYLFGEAYGHLPLGIIVKKNWDEQLHRPSIDRVGLMNVCNIPMQQSAYGDQSFGPAETELLRILGNLRTAGAATAYRDPAWGIVQEIVLRNLRKRLSELRDRPLVLVPCGRFAQKFFALADIHSPNWQVISDIPHPSYNNWSKPTYRAAIERLVTAFQRT